MTQISTIKTDCITLIVWLFYFEYKKHPLLMGGLNHPLWQGSVMHFHYDHLHSWLLIPSHITTGWHYTVHIYIENLHRRPLTKPHDYNFFKCLKPSVSTTLKFKLILSISLRVYTHQIHISWTRTVLGRAHTSVGWTVYVLYLTDRPDLQPDLS